jgi:hypothetical protein
MKDPSSLKTSNTSLMQIRRKISYEKDVMSSSAFFLAPSHIICNRGCCSMAQEQSYFEIDLTPNNRAVAIDDSGRGGPKRWPAYADALDAIGAVRPCGLLCGAYSCDRQGSWRLPKPEGTLPAIRLKLRGTLFEERGNSLLRVVRREG